MEDYKGYKKETVSVCGRRAYIIHPNITPTGKWAMKTEYFEAFPAVQLKLLELGYYVAYIENKTRWYVEEDNDAKAELAEYMIKTYNVSPKSVIIGMSCGGMQGIYFGSKYPQYVSCMYLDAPVVNLLSCPFNVGRAPREQKWLDEYTNSTGLTLRDLLSYRNHPLDRIDDLIKNKIPVILICGDSDTVVPYEENGKLLNDKYVKSGVPVKTIVKQGCNHHPHSLEDNTPIIDFILKYDK